MADSFCPNQFDQYAASPWLVVDPCADGGVGGIGGIGGIGGGADCGEVMSGQIDARDFACIGLGGAKSFDDLAVAFTGLRPGSVWLTRLEGNLSRAALEQDLEPQAASNEVAAVAVALLSLGLAWARWAPAIVRV